MLKLETLKDIENLIDSQIEEGLTLDYKEQLSKKNKTNKEIAKDIASFASAEGGTLIYGIKSRDRLPVEILWLEGNGIEERIQNVITTLIQPNINDVEILSVRNPENELQSIYVVQVPKSPDAPHMVQSIYYKRRGSTSMPMDHDEVLNTFLGAGRKEALRLEVNNNVDLLEKMYTLFDG
ncbi:MAG: ATP-binding protein, partial [Chloroflexi bacterium]|nr:ATP-binding protein [Chloroflexota bacterium]